MEPYLAYCDARLAVQRGFFAVAHSHGGSRNVLEVCRTDQVRKLLYKKNFFNIFVFVANVIGSLIRVTIPT